MHSNLDAISMRYTALKAHMTKHRCSAYLRDCLQLGVVIINTASEGRRITVGNSSSDCQKQQCQADFMTTTLYDTRMHLRGLARCLLQMAGGRAVPIQYDLPQSEVKKRYAQRVCFVYGNTAGLCMLCMLRHLYALLLCSTRLWAHQTVSTQY